MGQMQEYSDGDVIMYTTATGLEKYGAVVKCHDDYVTIVQLNEKEPHENGLAIRARSEMWCDCGRPAYVYYSNIDDVIRCLNEEELNRLREGIRYALGIESQPVTKPVNELVEREWNPPTSQDMLKDLAAIVSQEIQEVLEGHDEWVKACAQRDIYKELFEKEREY